MYIKHKSSLAVTEKICEYIQSIVHMYMYKCTYMYMHTNQ